MASPEEAADKKAAFLAELGKVEAYLAAHGPFFGGDKLDATDAAMAPKMYHALTALGEWGAAVCVECGGCSVLGAHLQHVLGVSCCQSVKDM
jgi:glutathione S-transferase